MFTYADGSTKKSETVESKEESIPAVNQIIHIGTDKVSEDSSDTESEKDVELADDDQYTPKTPDTNKGDDQEEADNEPVVQTAELVEAIPYETEKEESDELFVGESRVEREGMNGEKTTTFEVTVKDGVEIDRQEVSSEITVEPVNEIILVGTKETSRVRLNTEPKVIEYSTLTVVEYGTREKTDPSTPTHKGVRINNVQYTTSKSDTLQSIADQFGTTADRIRRDNNLNSDSVRSGTPLVINNALARPMDIPQSRDNRRVVMLDAGHGGSDPGATAYVRQEKVINMQMTNILRNKLINRGYEVQMVRDGDMTIKNLNRGRIANESDADIYISIHQNAANHNAQGIETFYYRYSPNYQSAINKDAHNDAQRVTNSKHLASLIQEEMINETNDVDRGVKRASFEVLRETNIPAALLEGGFLDSVAEGEKLADPAYQDRLMESVARAVDRYFDEVHSTH